VSQYFKCDKCNHTVRKWWNFCPFCGTKNKHRPTPVSTKPEVSAPKTFEPRTTPGLFVLVSEFRALIQPLIDLNGIVWLAREIGVNERRVRYVFQEQTFLREETVERWLIKLGLFNALYDGTIKPVKRVIPEPPESQYFED
jgi:hypothetical protein